MTDPNDMYFRPRPGTRMERVAEIMSRAHCMRSDQGETEEQIEARHAADRARAAVHDAYFAAEFVAMGGALPISRKLAASLGYSVEPADDGYGDMGDMGDRGNPDPGTAPPRDYSDHD